MTAIEINTTTKRYAQSILYLSDLDGTLLNPNAELSNYAIETLNRLIEQGLCFTVATARTAATAELILSRLIPSLPIILMNGALIYDRTSKKYERILYLSTDTVKQTIQAVASAGMRMFLYTLIDETLNTWHEPRITEPMRVFVEERKQKYYKTFTQVDSLHEAPSTQVVYFTLLDERDRIFAMRDTLSKIPGLGIITYLDIYDGLWYLEAFHETASKKNAALYLKDRYGFERLAGFGDNVNDLPLLEACDMRFAVANALPEVKSYAHTVIGSNTEDGVVRWLAAHAL